MYSTEQCFPIPTRALDFGGEVDWLEKGMWLPATVSFKTLTVTSSVCEELIWYLILISNMQWDLHILKGSLLQVINITKGKDGQSHNVIAGNQQKQS
jgi:hypothetical protein